MKYTTATIYDFDGTLFDSPEEERGKELYFEATGQLWPFQGYWGRAESLQHPIIPDPIPQEMFFKKIVEQYRQDFKDKNKKVVLLTGRPFKHRKHVQKILASNQISFHEEYYRGMPGTKGRNTFEIKMNIIKERLIHDNLKVIDIWEDRVDHLSEFMTEAKRLKFMYKKHLEKVIIHDAPNFIHYEF
jgi:hypothetical protein